MPSDGDSYLLLLSEKREEMELSHRLCGRCVMSSAFNAWIILWALTQSFSTANADVFARKMSVHYGYNLRYEIRDIGTWYGATVYGSGACTTQVIIDDQFLGDMGEDDLWKGVLAHEWAHTIQGSKCANNEYGAQVIALDMLLRAGEFPAYFRWARFLQEKWGWTPEETFYHFQEERDGFDGRTDYHGDSGGGSMHNNSAYP
jgi:hypothetical protein